MNRAARRHAKRREDAKLNPNRMVSLAEAVDLAKHYAQGAEKNAGALVDHEREARRDVVERLEGRIAALERPWWRRAVERTVERMRRGE